MPKIKTKVVRVKDPDTGIWHDLPGVVSEESFLAAERASRSEQAAAASAESAAESAAYNAQLPVVEAMEAARQAAESARAAVGAAQDAVETAEDAVETADAASDTAAEAYRQAVTAASAANSAVQSATTAAVAATPDIVTGWLDQNITPADPPVVIDASLSVADAAADAKAAGDKITVLTNAVAELDRTLFKVPYTPSNMSVDSNGKIYLDKGYVNQTTGNSSATSTSSSVYGKYYRTQAGAGSSRPFLEIGNKALLVTLGLDWVQWTCFSYSGPTADDATHSNSRSAYISGTEAIFIPKNSTDTRFSLGFRGIGNGDANRPVFTDEQVNAIKDAIKFYVLTDNSLSIVGSAADAKAVGDAISNLTSGIAKEAERLGLHTVPDNIGVLNAIKRARQMTDIKWTPKFDIPHRYFGSYGPSGHTFRLYGGFKAGTEYTGLPYSEHRWIGSTWPFAAFMTSLWSDKTHLATFVPGSGSSDYADSTFYGVVCAVLVSYAINRPVTKSNSFLHVNGISEIGAITGSNIDSIKLGDIMYTPTHVTIITDIIKDEDGHVTDVEISEATSGGLENWNDLWGKYGGLCRRVMYKKTEFLDRASGFSLCRYAYIADVPYEYTDYSALAADGYYGPIGNYPVLPIQGNFIRQKSDEVRLIVTMDAAEDTRETTLPRITHVVVRRNGVIYGEPLEIQTQAADEVVTWNAAAGSTVTIKAGTRYVKARFDADDEAKFTAVMAAMSNGNALEYGRLSRFFKYGPTKTYIPSGRTVNTSSGGYKYLSKLTNGNHEFTIRRKTTEFVPYAVSFGNDINDLGSINGYSANVYDYTVTEVEDGNEIWYEFHFEVTPPAITSPELVPAVVSWKSVNYGVFEESATSQNNVVGNDGKSLFYHI
jgi:hypothetical protein